jgi:hypothetical protein
MREMAKLEKMCPPTWNMPMGSVVRRIARLGVRRWDMRTTGDMQSRLSAETNANWTMVSVTGYRKRLRMTLPVFDESADVVYQSAQRPMNWNVCGEKLPPVAAVQSRRRTPRSWRRAGLSPVARTSSDLQAPPEVPPVSLRWPRP